MEYEAHNETGNFISCFECAPAYEQTAEHTFFGSGLKCTYPNLVILNCLHVDGCNLVGPLKGSPVPLDLQAVNSLVFLKPVLFFLPLKTYFRFLIPRI